MMNDEEFAAFLAHYGVKGQKWGVVKKEDTSPVQKALKSNSRPSLTKEQQATFNANKAKHDAKFDKSEDDSIGWRPSKKEVAVVAIGAVATAAIIYKLKSGKQLSVTPFSKDDYLKVCRPTDTPTWISEFAGKPMSPADFEGIVGNTSSRVWTGSMITPQSFRRAPFTLPAGNQFYRISHATEHSFHATTYATASEADLSRYIHTFGDIVGDNSNLVSFKSNDAVNVPDMHTTLEAMHKVLVSEHGSEAVTPRGVIDKYNELSGGTWETPRAKKLLDVLRGQGYHAIVDEMDAGVFAEKPLVLFDKSVLTSKSVSPLKSLDLEHYASILTELSDRK